MSWRIVNGDCVEGMADLAEDSVDAVVTDPPYGLEFMGKDWDRIDAWRDGGGMSKPGLGERPTEWPSFGGETANPTCAACGGRRRGKKRCQCEAPDWRVRGEAFNEGDRAVARARTMQEWHRRWAEESLRVLRPGGHLLAFGGSRTYHRLAAGIEDAGFEIRDTIMWLYAQGFPKSKDAGEGRGTALKPAHEPIVVARKPLQGTVIDNVSAHGTGAINIDRSRIPFASAGDERETKDKNRHADFGTEPGGNQVYGDFSMVERKNYEAQGRWPANLILDEGAAEQLDVQSGERSGGGYPDKRGSNSVYDSVTSGGNGGPRLMGDVGGASRFFFCPKVGRLERDLGLADFEKKMLRWSSGDESPGTFQADGTDRYARNSHPTVKPVELMRWLCRLVTPPGGLLLDPFTGSGSTGIAAVLDSFDFIGFEKSEEYVRIAEARIERWAPYAGYELSTEDALRSAEREEMAKAAGQASLLD
jgi:site-specific DNA-methyltransferase (adenine-specific)